MAVVASGAWRGRLRPRGWASGVLIVALLSTPLGLFTCAAITCEGTPDPDYAGYWKPPTLLVTVAARPFGVLDCSLQARTKARGEVWETWECR